MHVCVREREKEKTFQLDSQKKEKRIFISQDQALLKRCAPVCKCSCVLVSVGACGCVCVCVRVKASVCVYMCAGESSSEASFNDAASGRRAWPGWGGLIQAKAEVFFAFDRG